jgi:hypothetical protein
LLKAPFFCVACSMTHKTVIALETLKLLRENLKLVNYLSSKDGTNWNVISDHRPWKYVKVKGQGHLHIIILFVIFQQKKIYALLGIEKLSTPLHWTCWKKLKSYALFVNFDLMQTYRQIEKNPCYRPISKTANSTFKKILV